MKKKENKRDNLSKKTDNSTTKKTIDFNLKMLFKPLPIALMVSFLLIIVLSVFLIQQKQLKTEFEEDYLQKAELNEKQIFFIPKIYFYSSASADTNQTSKPQWDLSILQYTDIAIYLQSNQENGYTEENTIKKMAVYDIQISDNENKKADLYFKDISQFGTYQNENEENRIDGTLNYEIINSYEMDYTKPQIYIGANNPIAVQFVQKGLEEHYIQKDTSVPILFNGSLLQKAGIPLTKMAKNVSFKIQIINQLDQEFIANVYFSIPLEDEEHSIYDGYFIKEVLNPSISFYRVK